MQGSTSSRHWSSEEQLLCPACHAPGERKISQSIQNLGRAYIRCSICQRFLRWAQSNRREDEEVEESAP